MENYIKYKTVRQFNIIESFLFLLFCISISTYALMDRDEGEIYPFIFALCTLLIGIIILIYHLSYDSKRKAFKKNGKCIHGVIVGADEPVSARGPRRFHLLISFSDGCDKTWYTEAYIGNPNDILKSCMCNIYKWKGRYIEADFHTLKKGEKPRDLKIPIRIRYSLPFWESGRIKDN